MQQNISLHFSKIMFEELSVTHPSIESAKQAFNIASLVKDQKAILDSLTSLHRKLDKASEIFFLPLVSRDQPLRGRKQGNQSPRHHPPMHQLPSLKSPRHLQSPKHLQSPRHHQSPMYHLLWSPMQHSTTHKPMNL